MPGHKSRANGPARRLNINLFERRIAPHLAIRHRVHGAAARQTQRIVSVLRMQMVQKMGSSRESVHGETVE